MNKHRKIVSLATLSILALSSVALAGSDGAHWSYTGHGGPGHWGDLDKHNAACKLGQEQSPINITGTHKAALPALVAKYQPGALKIVNNGHTVQVNVGDGSSLQIGDRNYSLAQFHFHTPSEEQVNGRRYDMVWHLVHKDPQGGLAVVGVLVKAGQKHREMGKIIAHLPKSPNKEQMIAAVKIDPAKMLPANLGYYHFKGSLTTPPCSEGVKWYVLKTPVEASPEQIARFKALFGSNARPVQPLNARVVQESQ